MLGCAAVGLIAAVFLPKANASYPDGHVVPESFDFKSFGYVAILAGLPLALVAVAAVPPRHALAAAIGSLIIGAIAAFAVVQTLIALYMYSGGPVRPENAPASGIVLVTISATVAVAASLWCLVRSRTP